MMRRTIAILVLLVLCLGGRAWGQGQIAPEVYRAVALNDGQRSQVEQYVGDLLPKLSSDDATEIKQARDRLLEPLRDRTASVAFRRLYADLMGAELAKLAAGERDVAAANAMRIAGELATTESADLLVGRLTDNRASMRLMAAAQLGRLFDTVGRSDGQPAMRPDSVTDLVNRLGKAAVGESSETVLDAMVRAMRAATMITRPGFEGTRAATFRAMCQALSNKAKALGQTDMGVLPALLRAQTACRDALAQANPLMAIDGPAAAAAVEFNGHMVACIMRNRGAFPVGDVPARDVASGVIRVAESAAVIGAAKLGGQYQSQQMADDFAKATADGDREFFRKALAMLGVLAGPPLNMGPFQGGR
jgi:hypothetical protein